MENMMLQPNLPLDFRNPRLIGSDRLHQVFRGEWKGTSAAIKTCEAALPGWLAESNLTLVENPRLPRFFASGQHEHTSYVVMEFVQGTEITALRTPPPSRWVCHQLCDALAALHAGGIPHADLSDRSVRWGLAGLRLVDIGIAPEAPSKYARAERYVAPEIRGGGEPTTASDMFSLGVLLSELAPDDSDVMEAVQLMKRHAPEERCSAEDVLEMLDAARSPVKEPARWLPVMSEARFLEELSGVLYPSVRAHLSRKLQDSASEELVQDAHAFLSTVLECDPQATFEPEILQTSLGALESDKAFVQKQTSMTASTLFSHWLDVLLEVTLSEQTVLGSTGYPTPLDPELECERNEVVSQLPIDEQQAGDALLDTIQLCLDGFDSVELSSLRFISGEKGVCVEKAK